MAAKKKPAGTKTPGSKLVKGEDGLNDKQRQFCAEYIVDLNATQAAIRAGYSQRTARAIAQELLVKAEVVAKVQALMDERANRTQVTADRVITEVARLGFADLRKLFDANGGLLPVDQWPDDIAAAVASVEVDELFQGYGENRIQVGYTKKVKLWDKGKALEMLGRHLKLFVDRHEHTGPDGGPIATRNDGIDLKKLTDAELEQLEHIVQAAEQRSAAH
jgi:phage terminase small subunit